MSRSVRSTVCPSARRSSAISSAISLGRSSTHPFLGCQSDLAVVQDNSSGRRLTLLGISQCSACRGLLIGFRGLLTGCLTTITAQKRFHPHFLCLGGRDVVVEAEEVVRVVAPLYLPQPLEVGISVGRAHAFDGLVGSSVVEVTAAARRALLERGGRAPRPGDVGGVRGRVLPRGGGADV